MNHIFMGLIIMSMGCLFSFKGQASMATKSIYKVLNFENPNFIQDTFGFNTPERDLPVVKLPFGHKIHQITVPWSVRGQMVQVIGLADKEAVVQNLDFPKKQLKPVLVNGKAIVVLFFLNYDDSSSGAYEEAAIAYVGYRGKESGLSFSSLEEYLNNKVHYGSKILTLVDHLSLGGPDDEFPFFQPAIWGGRVAISYPKYYGRTSIEFVDKEMHFSISQPQVEYFNSGQPDAKKAGTLNLSISGSVDSRQTLDHQVPTTFFDYHAAHTSDGKLCVMGNHIYSEISEIKVKQGNLKMILSGNSESSKTLSKVHFEPKKVIHGKNTQIYMFREDSPSNDCGNSFKKYNYKLFYPKRLLPL